MICTRCENTVRTTYEEWCEKCHNEVEGPSLALIGLGTEEHEDKQERRGMPYAALAILTRAGIPMHAPAGGAL